MTHAPADVIRLRPTRKGGLEPVLALARSIKRASWFAACGEAMSGEEIADAQAYLGGLGLAVAAIEPVADWATAQAITRRPDWSPAWWDAEEAARRSLYATAAAASAEETLLAALSAVTQAASDTVHGAAAIAASRQGGTDPAFLRVAAGAATQACYHAALAVAVGPDHAVGEHAVAAHAFNAKYRLFAAGRWPLGIVGDRCFVF